MESNVHGVFCLKYNVDSVAGWCFFWLVFCFVGVVLDLLAGKTKSAVCLKKPSMQLLSVVCFLHSNVLVPEGLIA